MCLHGMDRESITFYQYFTSTFGFNYSTSSAETTSSSNSSCSLEFRKAFEYENRLYSSWKIVTGTRWCVKVCSHCWGVLPSVHCCVRPRQSGGNGWRITATLEMNASYLCLVTSWSNEISDCEVFQGFFFITMAARLLAARTHGSRRTASELGTMPCVCGLGGFISFRFFRPIQCIFETVIFFFLQNVSAENCPRQAKI